jgi:hypothetical protein
MAVEIGTAANHADLLTRLRAFLTANADLVAAGQAWTEVGYNAPDATTEETYLRGPGLGGGEEIYVQIRRYENVAGDYYNWGLRGAVNYNPAEPFGSQPGASPESHFTLWNTSIPYWFVANGRRFMVVAKVSTVYVMLHAGLILPYATPAEYPYPIFVGANCRSAMRWSVGGDENRNVFDPGALNDAGYCRLRYVDGTWIGIANHSGDADDRPGNTWPYEGFRQSWIGFPISALGGDYVLTPIILSTGYEDGVVFGELDGVFHVSGFSTASENIVTIEGVDHLVVQNVYRAGTAAYAAVRLA